MAVISVRVDDAIGKVLGHDLTKIVPGEYKGPVFRKGHIIQPEDIPYLKNIGKEHIYLIDLAAGQLHENDAISRMANTVAGKHVVLSDPAEGKITIRAGIDGLLKIEEQAVHAINLVEYAVLSTRHGNVLVKQGDLLAAVKVVPLVVEEQMIATIEAIAAQYPPIISVQPLRRLKIGSVITGNEVYFGRIKDRFASVFTEKARLYNSILLGTVHCPDDRDRIRDAILTLKQQGADVIIASGGMSVDPDDVTSDAIAASGATVITYGTPVLPGAMFMVAYLGDTAVLGMPACGMFAKITVLDLILPRILAGERLTRPDITAMGYGGLCLSCEACTFPNCCFGK
jgi:molybdopterin biosynthesis enzyme